MKVDPAQPPVEPSAQPLNSPAPPQPDSAAPHEQAPVSHMPSETSPTELPTVAEHQEVVDQPAEPVPITAPPQPAAAGMMPQAPPTEATLDNDLAAISASMATQEETAADGVMPVDRNLEPTPQNVPGPESRSVQLGVSAETEQNSPAPLASPAIKKKGHKKIILVAAIIVLILGLAGGYISYTLNKKSSQKATAVPEQKLATGTVGSLSSKYPKVWVVTDSDSWDFYAQDMSNQDKNNMSYLGIAILPYSASSGYKNFADAKASTAKNYMDKKSAIYKPTDILKKDRVLNGKDAYYVEFKAPGIKSSDNPQPENLHSKAVLLAYDDNNAMLIEMQVTDTQAVEINEFENIVNAITIKK